MIMIMIMNMMNNSGRAREERQEMGEPGVARGQKMSGVTAEKGVTFQVET